MLYDLPRGQTQVEPMLRIDLDNPPTPESPVKTILAMDYPWSGPTRQNKSISPKMKLFLDPEESKGGKVGWQRLQEELTRIGLNEPYFQEAADALLANSEAILAFVAKVHKGTPAARKLHKRSPKGDGPPDRILFHFKGAPLQAHPAYEPYYEEEYGGAREKSNLIDALGVEHEVLHTAPRDLKDSQAKLGQNIPLGDRESSRWGYVQNTGMWITEAEYIARLKGLETLVPKYKFSTGTQDVYIAVLDLSLTQDARGWLNKAIMFMESEALEASETWLPAELQSIWEGAPQTASLPLNQDLRLAIYYPEKARLRMMTYEPLNAGTFIKSLRDFRAHYGRFRIPTIEACLESPNHSKNISQQRVLYWTRRIFFGGRVSLGDASRALRRFLVEMKSKDAKDPQEKDMVALRRTCQIKVMEDYLSGLNVQGSEFYRMGQFVSECANIAFRTGKASFQNKEDNLYAKARAADFTTHFLLRATIDPVRTIHAMAFKLTTYIKAIPARHRALQATLQGELARLLASCPVPSRAMTPEDRLCIWKGHSVTETERREKWKASRNATNNNASSDAETEE